VKPGGRELPAADREIDVSGLDCPLPLLSVKKALSQLASGQHLRVSASGADAPRDLLQFAKLSGNVLIHAENTGSGWSLIFRRR
jgi:tRNA 2-thiouridine synthesizing protein A